MKKRELKIGKSFNPKSQRIVGLFAAQLDEQLSNLKRFVKDLTVKQLEWQPKPGINTIGMLLAHFVVAEYFWTKIAPHGFSWNPDGQKMIMKAFGIEDDGIPLPANGKHPRFLKGFTVASYFSMLDKSRRIRNNELKKWFDKDLDKLYQLGKKTQCSRTATLHHVLEHFCAHFGQILLLKHMMRDAGILKAKK